MLRRCALLLAFLLASAPLRADELLVHAAASLAGVMKEIGARHEKATGVRVSLNLAGTNVLARQISEGAPGDLFFSADEARMDQVEKSRLLLPGTRVSLLSNTLVVVVRADSRLALATSADLATSKIASVALADPGSVPAGIYAKEHLRRIGAWSRVLPKVVPTENVRAALSAVESGNVDAGIVYATDARGSKLVRVAYGVPPADAPDIRYPVAVLAGSRSPDQARALLALLQSPEAAEIFRAHGFLLPER